MHVMTYQELALDWKPSGKREYLYNIYAVAIVAIFLVAGISMSLVELPEEKTKTRIEVPERVAKFILNKPKPKPRVKKEVLPKPKPKPRVARKKPEKVVKLTKKQEVARKKAEQSGLLALGNELSDLMDTSAVDKMVNRKVTSSGEHHTAARMDTSKLNKNADSGSKGVSSASYMGNVGNTKLSQQERSITRKLLSARAVKKSQKTSAAQNGQYKRTGNYRSEEDIAYIMDLNKGNLHTIYRRARRHNPALKGKIVLEITILSTGKVSRVRIKSSELNDPELERRLLARVKQINFGTQNVKTVTVTFPVEFLPS